MDAVANSIERRVKARRGASSSKPEDIQARIAEIERLAPPLGQKYTNWLPHSDKSFYYWTFFEASNYQTLPFIGGLADQPCWLLDDFGGFIDLTEYNELGVEREELLRKLSNV